MSGGFAWSTAVLEDVFETYVECAVGVRCECVAGFAGDVAGAGVVVSYCVFDLYSPSYQHWLQRAWLQVGGDGVLGGGKWILTCMFKV